MSAVVEMRGPVMEADLQSVPVQVSCDGGSGSAAGRIFVSSLE